MPTVLIADNDRAVSGLLSDVLQRYGLQLEHAYDGEEAWRLARSGSPDVLVCDLDMPGRSGLDVLESLRELDAPPTSVVISGYLDASIEERLRALPFVEQVFRKPFDLLVFAGAVRRLASRAAAARIGRAEGEEGAATAY